MPRDERVGIKIDTATWRALESAKALAEELWGIPYGSVSDFILDALRERVRAVNAEWVQRNPEAARLRRPPGKS